MAKVKFFATFREVTQEKETEVKACSVEELLHKFVDKYGKKFEKLVFEKDEIPTELKLRDYVKILVNGRNIEHLDKLKTRLKNDDIVAIFPPVGGG